MKSNVLIKADGSVEVKQNLEKIQGNFPEFFKLDTIDEGSDMSMGDGVFVHTKNTKEGSWTLITVNKKD